MLYFLGKTVGSHKKEIVANEGKHEFVFIDQFGNTFERKMNLYSVNGSFYQAKTSLTSLLIHGLDLALFSNLSLSCFSLKISFFRVDGFKLSGST